MTLGKSFTLSASPANSLRLAVAGLLWQREFPYKEAPYTYEITDIDKAYVSYCVNYLSCGKIKIIFEYIEMKTLIAFQLNNIVCDMFLVSVQIKN